MQHGIKAWATAGRYNTSILRDLLIALILGIGCYPSSAAIIGPKDDWIDIRDAEKACPPNADPHLACGLSHDQIDAILKAGYRMNCGGYLNAWALKDPSDGSVYLYTNWHGFMHDPDTWEPNWRTCTFSPYTDPSIELAYNPTSLRLGSKDGYKKAFWNDRARVELKGIEPEAPLIISSDAVRNVRQNDRVLFVSINPATPSQVRAEFCIVMRPPSFKPTRPGILDTDCDNTFGNSGGLLLTPNSFDKGAVSALDPVAIHQGNMQKVGDYQAWDFQNNTSVNQTIDENFLSQFVSRSGALK